METVTLNLKEQKKLTVVIGIEAGRMTTKEGAEVLNLSERQTYRLRKAYREKGAAGLLAPNQYPDCLTSRRPIIPGGVLTSTLGAMLKSNTDSFFELLD